MGTRITKCLRNPQVERVPPVVPPPRDSAYLLAEREKRWCSTKPSTPPDLPSHGNSLDRCGLRITSIIATGQEPSARLRCRWLSLCSRSAHHQVVYLQKSDRSRHAAREAYADSSPRWNAHAAGELFRAASPAYLERSAARRTDDFAVHSALSLGVRTRHSTGIVTWETGSV